MVDRAVRLADARFEYRDLIVPVRLCLEGTRYPTRVELAAPPGPAAGEGASDARSETSGASVSRSGIWATPSMRSATEPPHEGCTKRASRCGKSWVTSAARLSVSRGSPRWPSTSSRMCAVRLLAAAAGLRDVVGDPPSPNRQEQLDRLLEA